MTKIIHVLNFIFFSFFTFAGNPFKICNHFARGLVILLVLNIPINTYSQENENPLTEKSNHQSATISTINYNQFCCSQIKSAKDTISFLDINKNLQESIAITKLDHNSASKRNHWLEGMICGGLIFQSYTLICGIDNHNPYNGEKCGTIILNTALGMGIGCLIGSMIPK